jgi:protoporphyrinogen/coproporphyrinogen III oxidase
VDHEESVHDYAARHIGPEAAEVLLGTMVRGVYGGDAHKLSVDAAFPIMREMERDHGSLVIAGLAGMPSGCASARPPGASAAACARSSTARRGPRRRAAAGHRRDRPRADPAGGFRCARPAASERVRRRRAGLPPAAAAACWRRSTPRPRDELAASPTRRSAWSRWPSRNDALRTPPDGFGFLVAPSEDLRVLGVLIESNVFPGRAPDGTVLVRVIMGGVDDPAFDAQRRRDRGDRARRRRSRLGRARRAAADVGRPPGARHPAVRLGHHARLARIEGAWPASSACTSRATPTAASRSASWWTTPRSWRTPSGPWRRPAEPSPARGSPAGISRSHPCHRP